MRASPGARCGAEREAQVIAACGRAACSLPHPASSRAQTPSPGAGLSSSSKPREGDVEFETYPEEAPKTVARVLELVKKGFYDGLRFHRAEADFLVQIGDPATRDLARQAYGAAAAAARRSAWPRSPRSGGTSGAPSAWPTPASNPKAADSQFYIVSAAGPSSTASTPSSAA